MVLRIQLIALVLAAAAFPPAARAATSGEIIPSPSTDGFHPVPEPAAIVAERTQRIQKILDDTGQVQLPPGLFVVGQLRLDSDDSIVGSGRLATTLYPAKNLDGPLIVTKRLEECEAIDAKWAADGIPTGIALRRFGVYGGDRVHNLPAERELDRESRGPAIDVWCAASNFEELLIQDWAGMGFRLRRGSKDREVRAGPRDLIINSVRDIYCNRILSGIYLESGDLYADALQVGHFRDVGVEVKSGGGNVMQVHVWGGKTGVISRYTTYFANLQVETCEVGFINYGRGTMVSLFRAFKNSEHNAVLKRLTGIALAYCAYTGDKESIVIEPRAKFSNINFVSIDKEDPDRPPLRRRNRRNQPSEPENPRNAGRHAS